MIDLPRFEFNDNVKFQRFDLNSTKYKHSKIAIFTKKCIRLPLKDYKSVLTTVAFHLIHYTDLEM